MILARGAEGWGKDALVGVPVMECFGQHGEWLDGFAAEITFSYVRYTR